MVPCWQSWLQELTAHLASASRLAPPAASTAAAQQWVATADKLMHQSTGFRADFMTSLEKYAQEVDAAVQMAFVELKQQVRQLYCVKHRRQLLSVLMPCIQRQSQSMPLCTAAAASLSCLCTSQGGP